MGTDKALAELPRVLEPGGRLTSTEHGLCPDTGVHVGRSGSRAGHRR